MHAFDGQTDRRTDFDSKTVRTHSQSRGKNGRPRCRCDEYGSTHVEVAHHQIQFYIICVCMLSGIGLLLRLGLFVALVKSNQIIKFICDTKIQIPTKEVKQSNVPTGHKGSK